MHMQVESISETASSVGSSSETANSVESSSVESSSVGWSSETASSETANSVESSSETANSIWNFTRNVTLFLCKRFQTFILKTKMWSVFAKFTFKCHIWKTWINDIRPGQTNEHGTLVYNINLSHWTMVTANTNLTTHGCLTVPGCVQAQWT